MDHETSEELAEKFSTVANYVVLFGKFSNYFIDRNLSVNISLN